MRDIPVGNGSLLVNFDDKYQIRDVYFPRVGLENHTEGYPSRFGIWVDGQFSWISDDSWSRSIKYLNETLVTDVRLVNESLGIEIISNDTVASHENIFLRRLRVSNLRDVSREVRIFLHHDFRISENNIGDTAYFDPETAALIHYKRDRYFLINTAPSFDEVATGRKAFRDQEGTWRDAEDGILQGGTITEGSVDSTIAVKFTLEAQAFNEFYYWICAAKSRAEAMTLNDYVKIETPAGLLHYTENYWRVWVNKNDTDFDGLAPEIVDLYKRSLLIIRTQTDRDGAILAANDSDVTERATDHYSYVWTRDGALVANALDLAGYSHMTRLFFEFCSRIVHQEGYFLQKYNSDATLASGWHASWDKWTNRQLVPIQEDETALVLWTLWEHYDRYRDIEFVRALYRPLIVKCADFMLKYREDRGLPKASWNLWEDRRGIHSFTCGTIVGGLRAAGKFADLFGETERAVRYEKAAIEMTAAIRQHLYSPELGRFVRSLETQDDVNFAPDTAIGAEEYALFYFGAFAADDQLIRQTMREVEKTLWVNTAIGGVARFENDGYMRVTEKVTGNPWFICTLWLADYRIAIAKSEKDLKGVVEILEWTVARAQPSGVLAEQVNPLTGAGVSVGPLTWSHSTFIATVANYLRKLRELRVDNSDGE